jgi:ABC-type transporter Mla subunit MlaD
VSLLAQDEGLARRVGAVAVLVMGAAIACLVFLLDRVALGSPIQIRVVFHHVAGLHEHAALVVGGQPVGRIEAISPLPHGAGGLLAGEVGVAVTVTIAGDNVWKVPAASEIFVASRGPLSDRYLEVAPPHGDPGPAIHDGQELRGVDPPSLDNIMQHTWTNMTTFKLFVEAVKPELQALGRELDELQAQVGQLTGPPPGTTGGASAGVAALASETRRLLAAARHTYDSSLGGDAGIAGVRAMVRDARATVAEIRAAIDLLGPRAAAIAANLARVRGHLAGADPIARGDQAIAQLRAALDKIDPLLAKLDELGERIAAGEGSFGRLIQDPEFPEDAKDLGKIMKRQFWKIIARPPD